MGGDERVQFAAEAVNSADQICGEPLWRIVALQVVGEHCGQRTVEQVRLIQHVQCVFACLVACGRRHYTREEYSPERVSTLTRSPTLMNSGTCTTAPVSIVAGLVAPETRSP